MCGACVAGRAVIVAACRPTVAACCSDGTHAVGYGISWRWTLLLKRDFCTVPMDFMTDPGTVRRRLASCRPRGRSQISMASTVQSGRGGVSTLIVDTGCYAADAGLLAGLVSYSMG